jgi:hypothetical protein
MQRVAEVVAEVLAEPIGKWHGGARIQARRSSRWRTPRVPEKEKAGRKGMEGVGVGEGGKWGLPVHTDGHGEASPGRFGDVRTRGGARGGCTRHRPEGISPLGISVTARADPSQKSSWHDF